MMNKLNPVLVIRYYATISAQITHLLLYLEERLPSFSCHGYKNKDFTTLPTDSGSSRQIPKCRKKKDTNITITSLKL